MGLSTTPRTWVAGETATAADMNTEIRDNMNALNNSGALTLILPTSVAGTGVTLTGGKVTYSGASAVSVNGCFSAAFDNYVILISGNARSAVVDGLMRLRAAGTDATASVYSDIRDSSAASASIVATRTANATWIVDCGGQPLTDTRIELFSPALAAATHGSYVADSAPTLTVAKGAVYHSAATAFDGFTYFPTSGTIGGTLRVYGYNNG